MTEEKEVKEITADAETERNAAEPADLNEPAEISADTPTESFDDNPTRASDCGAEAPQSSGNGETPNKKKRFKPWKSLDKKGKANRVLALAMLVALVAILVFVGVWCGVIAKQAYSEPQWVSEREVYRENIVREMQKNGNGIFVPETDYGERARWFLTAKEPYDMRFTLFPEGENLAGYRYMFLETYRGATEPTMFVFNVYGLIGETDLGAEGQNVGQAWGFEAREKATDKFDGEDHRFKVYSLSASIGGHLYRVTAEYETDDGAMNAEINAYLRQYAGNILKTAAQAV